MLFATSLITLFALLSATHADPTAPLKRQAGPEDNSTSALTLVTPSPGAAPIPITKQSQEVTSQVPVLTVCPQAANSSTATPALNGSSSPTTTCDTIYSATLTTVCYTELPALISKATVTACDQPLTFSERLGFTMPSQANPTEGSGASISTITTYFIAPWQQLTANTPPSTSVTARACSLDSKSSLACTDSLVEPRTSVITGVVTSTMPLKINTDVQGPAKVLAPSTSFDIGSYQTNINLDTQYITERPTTSTSVSYATPSQGASAVLSSMTTANAAPAVAAAASDASPISSGTQTDGSLNSSADSTPVLGMTQSSYGNMAAMITASGPTTFSSQLSTSTRTVTVNITITTGSDGPNGTGRRTTTVSSTSTMLNTVTMTRSPTLATPSFGPFSNSTASTT